MPQKGSLANNKKAYEVLFKLERALRLFIIEKLSENIDGGWVEGIPKDILKKCEKRSQIEKEVVFQKIVEGEGLIIDYADFRDLKKIITENWEIFNDYFISQDLIENKLGELELPRNAIAHNRILAKTECDRISVYASDLTQCMKIER
jgi:hypothetical protein